MKFYLFFLLIFFNNSFSERVSKSYYQSFRVLGLSVHLIDVNEDAPHYPLKLSNDGKFVLDPGLQYSLDIPTFSKLIPHIRILNSIFFDCAFQPAGFFGGYVIFPNLTFGKISFRGGLGPAVAIRRNWQKYVIDNHESETYSNWGVVEGAAGISGELEFGFQLSEETEIIFDYVPGFPYIFLFSFGVRVKV